LLDSLLQEFSFRFDIFTMRMRGGTWLMGVLLFVAVGNLETEAQKDIPEPKFSKLMGPTIKFMYCYS